MTQHTIGLPFYRVAFTHCGSPPHRAGKQAWRAAVGAYAAQLEARGEAKMAALQALLLSPEFRVVDLTFVHLSLQASRHGATR